MIELIKETMNSYNDYLSEVPKGCQEISNLLRENNIKTAMNLIAEFSEGVIWLTTANKHFKNNDISCELNTDKIHEFLYEINHGLEIQDYVLVADMFEYEITPFFSECLLLDSGIK